jgi:Cu-processing system permease protein
MLGFTGAVFKQTFGTGWGIFFSSSLLFLWMIIPFMISLRKFNKKDH